MKKIYVGNLPFSATETEVKELFEEFGTVTSISLIADRNTGRFRGFGFVEMDDREASTAIMSLNGRDLGGRSMTVNEARDRQSRTPSWRY
jgi:RNA recognition motif-containing protein